MYPGYITDIEGIKVGHAQSYEGVTGCTVIIAGENGFTGGVDVRGSGPGTRETDIFTSEKMIEKVHGIVLTGGSAFGLNSASGVMEYLEEKEIGFDVGVTKVPIVSGAVLFDLLIGDSKIRPGHSMGYEAAKNASSRENRQGNIGAGTGATIGKILGPEYSMKSGLGSATVTAGDLKVSAMVAVNSVGDIYDFETGKQIAGVYDYEKKELLNTIDIMKKDLSKEMKPLNTTIGIVATNGILTKPHANKVAEMAHNGLARTIDPVHTMLDGDTVYCLASNEVEADVNIVGSLAAEAMAKAIINGVKSAESIEGYISYKDLI